MIAIVDYGVGNLFSLRCSLEFIGVRCAVTDDENLLCEAGGIILPGVGAFGDAAAKLRAKGLDKAVVKQAKAGKPLLGICLGMQLLFEKSYEYGEHEGLSLISGEVEPLTQELIGGPLKIPHMGWNALEGVKNSPLLRYTKEGEQVYYVHSYFAKVSGDTAAYSCYGNARVTGVVQSGNVFGTQFHPEKSGRAGLAILKAFAGLEGKK